VNENWLKTGDPMNDIVQVTKLLDGILSVFEQVALQAASVL
jgi:hypothetical protein